MGWTGVLDEQPSYSRGFDCEIDAKNLGHDGDAAKKSSASCLSRTSNTVQLFAVLKLLYSERANADWSYSVSQSIKRLERYGDEKW